MMRVFVITCMLGLLFAVSAQAEPRRLTQVGPADTLQLAQQDHISPREAIRRAQRRYDGKVLSVELRGSGENAYYEVKLIKNGEVRVVRVRATG